MVITTVPQTMAAFFPRQLRLMSEAGFDVHAVSGPDETLERLRQECGVTTHGVPMARQVDPRRDAASLLQLLQLIRRLRPDVVHAHTPKAGLLGMAAARIAGVPVRLYTVHGLPLMTRTGIWRKTLEAAERASASLSTRTYCVSRSLRQEILDLGICGEAKVFTLGDGSCSGIDLEQFRPAERRNALRPLLGIPAGATVATFVGRLANDKGLAVLAEAWPEVARQRPEMHLVVAGEEDTTDPVAPRVLERMRLDPSIHWTGKVPAAEVPGIYCETDICVLPTFREGLSQVALEAGAMGVPIVSSNVAGLVDSVVNGVTGLLVAPKEPTLLAEAIVKLAASPDLRHQMGTAGIEHVRTKYSDHRVNHMWIAEYLTLTSSASSAGQMVTANRHAKWPVG